MFVTITNYSDHKVIFVRTKKGSFKFDLKSKLLTPAKPTVGFHINICEEPEDLTGFLSRVFSSKVGEVFNANHGLKTLPKVSPRYSSEPVYFWVRSDDEIFSNITSEMVSKTKPESGDVRSVTLQGEGAHIAVIGKSGVGKTYLTHELFNHNDIFETDSCSKDSFLNKYKGQKFIVIGQRDKTFDLDFVKERLDLPSRVMEISKSYKKLKF